MLSRFGRTQLRIMLVLWEKGHATAREIAEELKREGPIADSTVQTLLRRLEKKGAVTHDIEGRTFIFRPLKDQEDLLRNSTHDLIEYLFGGSPTELISHLLTHEHFTPQQKETFRTILEKLAKKQSPGNKKDE